MGDRDLRSAFMLLPTRSLGPRRLRCLCHSRYGAGFAHTPCRVSGRMVAFGERERERVRKRERERERGPGTVKRRATAAVRAIRRCWGQATLWIQRPCQKLHMHMRRLASRPPGYLVVDGTAQPAAPSNTRSRRSRGQSSQTSRLLGNSWGVMAERSRAQVDQLFSCLPLRADIKIHKWQSDAC